MTISLPPGSEWMRFGPTDQAGRLNLLSERCVLAGIAEVVHGRRFCLSLPLDYPGGQAWNRRRFPPRLSAVDREGVSNIGYPASSENPEYTDILNDQFVRLDLQYSTHWDSLVQVGQIHDKTGKGLPTASYYNGYEHEADVFPASCMQNGNGQPAPDVCARRLGIEQMAENGVQGRAVLIDIERHFGPERRDIGFREISAILKQDRITVQHGDIVLFNTGFGRLVKAMGGKPDVETLRQSGAELNGSDGDLLRWITDNQISAIASDHHSIEKFQPPTGRAGQRVAMLPLHEHCLFKLGLHLGELWYLSDLADWFATNHRHACLLTAPPLRLPGAVASPVTPIATV